MQMKRLDDPNMTQSKTGPRISHIKKNLKFHYVNVWYKN